jgi:hypothetical protein
MSCTREHFGRRFPPDPMELLAAVFDLDFADDVSFNRDIRQKFRLSLKASSNSAREYLS